MYRIRTRRCLSACIEQVELRRLLATLVGNQLNIDGTAGDDRIRVETVGANVVVTTNNTPQSFDKNLVRTVVANLRSGNDRIDIVWNVNAPTTISGEAGNDTVVGGSYSDFIFTGSGNDAVYGSAGNDLIETSIGDDFVAPGFGNDTIDTGAGNDRVSYDDRSSPIMASLVANYRVSTGNPATMELVSDGKMVAGSETDTYKGAETLIAGGGNDTLTLRGATMRSATPISTLFEIRGGSGDDRLTLRFPRPAEETVARGTIDDLSPAGTPVALNAPAASRAAANTATQTSRTPLAADGGAGNDCIVGSEGDDLIRPGFGNDTIDGGAGNDEVSYADRSAAIEGRLDAYVHELPGPQWLAGRVVAEGERDTLLNVETLTGSTGNDSLSLYSTHFVLGAENPLLARLNGGEGNDQFWFEGYWSFGYYGIDAVGDGGAGHDSFSYRYSSSQLTLHGGDGNDTIASDDDEVFAPTFYPGSGVDLFSFHGDFLDYTMPPGLENISAGTGHGSIRVVGNDLPNQIHVIAPLGAYVDGRGGDDQITAPYAVDNTLLGGTGNDTITASDGADRIDGGAGDDSLSGLGGDDTILPGAGNDTIDGGAGNDEVSYSDRSTPITGTLSAYVYEVFGNPPLQWIDGLVQAGSESDQLFKTETLAGGTGDDVLRLTMAAFNPFVANTLAARLVGGDGADTISFGGVYQGMAYAGIAATGDGGAGNDRFAYSYPTWLLTLYGGDGNDTIGSNDDDVYAPNFVPGAGIDYFDYQGIDLNYTMPDGLENVRIIGDIGHVRIIGNDLSNTIEVWGNTYAYVEGRGGDDRITLLNPTHTSPATLLGGEGNDTLTGGDGNDLIDGGAGNDSIDGLGGDDTILPGTGNDTVDSGLGQDVVSYADRSTSIRGDFDATVRYATDPSQGPYGFAWWSTTASVTSGTESDTVVNLEVLTGSQGDDVLRFKTYDIGGTIPTALQSQVFRLNGGGGNDGMDALMESDTRPDRHASLTLDGGEGNDRIGGYAVFVAIGGSGDDYFQAVGDDATAPTIDAGPGVDTFEFTRIGPTYRMPDGLENLIIAHTQGEYIYVEGNDLANTIWAKARGGTVYIDGRGGNDHIILEQALSIALTTLLGGDGNDTILGNDSADLIDGGAGDDSINGGGGDDTILPGTGNDTIDAGEGNDEVSYADRTSPVSITFGHSIVLVGPPAQYVVFSDATVTSGDETDVLRELETTTLTPANDSVYMTAYRWSDYHGPLQNRTYRINAGDGDDRITVDSGIETASYTPDFVHGQLIDGGRGNDTFDTFVRPTTTLIGGEGNDSFYAGYTDSHEPTIDAGSGRDFFYYHAMSINYVMPAGLEDMSANAEYGSARVIGNDLPNVILIGAQDAAYTDGGGGDDTITRLNPGHPSPTTLIGGEGNDTLTGGDGHDSIDGGEGNDYLDGGLGADSIYGGAGTDTANRDDADAIVDSIEVFVGKSQPGVQTRKLRERVLRLE
jgi:Ca2+-binding RTX toxin-like protein